MSKASVTSCGVTVTIEQEQATCTEAVTVMLQALLGAGYMLESILDSMEGVVEEYRDE